MKLIILLSLVTVALASPPRWSLLEDHFGNVHLVDLNPIDAEVENFDAFNEVYFMLFTRANPTVGQRIGFDRASVLNSNWNNNHDVRILVHGWSASHTAAENIVTTAEFLRRGQYNVIGELSHL